MFKVKEDMLITEYYKYCIQNNLYVRINELSTIKTYYWHPSFDVNVYCINFEKINGNTYIFSSNKSILGLSAYLNFIMGLSENESINTFDFKKYIEE